MLCTCFSTVPSVTQRRCGDARVGATFSHQLEHLALARAEVGEWIADAARGDELLHERGVDGGAALQDAVERVEELVHVRDPALQEVAAALAAREQVHRVLDVDVRRQHQDRRLRASRRGSRGRRPGPRSCASAAS